MQLAFKGHLLASVKQMQQAYLGRILKKKGDCLEKQLLQGITPGSRARGRPKMTQLDITAAWTGLSLLNLARKVERPDSMENDSL